ncbi:MAG: tail fiber domain-containing protein [Verrucomicrobiae bacterium]|nr:tail fiber domain-containing protein [Verrucomicrobiae bacterium]
MKPHLSPFLLALLFGIPLTPKLHAQATALTYQGRLDDGGAPAKGIYDLRFTIYDAASGGAAQGVTLTNSPVAVSNGLFTVTLDFGDGVFDGGGRWLEIGVRTNGGGSFQPLSPRQRFTSTPYALRALTVGDGAVAGAYSSQVSFSNPANEFTGTFTGDGSALSNINVTTLGGFTAGDFWQLGGNAGTTAGVNYLGTSDNQPLELKVNGQRVIRWEMPSADWPVVIGGSSANSIGGGSVGSVIGGGGSPSNPNTIGPNSLLSVVGGGGSNHIAGLVLAGTIAGGSLNELGLDADFSTIAGGHRNRIADSAFNATIAGGLLNVIDAFTQNGAIGGGSNNRLETGAWYGTVAGGANNSVGAASDLSVIGGGAGNLISSNSSSAAIGGGILNLIGVNGDASAIGGGSNNVVGANAPYSTIGGGRNNTISTNAPNATIAGGRESVVTGVDATVGGGSNNEANSTGATSSGGINNRVMINSPWATISGGYNNTATGTGSVIGGGNANATTNSYSTVAGGQGNVASKQFAAVPGGANNTADGNYAFAAGRRAKANHTGAFVWGDAFDGDVVSTNNNSVTLRASGGYRLFSDTGASAGVFLAPGGNSWASISDRNRKKDIQPLDSQAVLARLAALPVSTWRYDFEPAEATPHIGPMAQDFKAAFYPGRDNTTISTMEFDGVALAAIQGLNQKLEQREAEVRNLQDRLAKLEEQIARFSQP